MAEVLFFMADGFEETEGITAVDLIRRAGISVEMVAVEDRLLVTGAHGITVKADKLFQEAGFSDCRMLVLPGGMPGTRNLLAHGGLAEKIKEFNSKGKMLAAICAAPIVLGAAGVLDNRRVTCFPGFENQLGGGIFTEEPVVCDENIITSRGVGTAIEFALRIIAYFKGEREADAIRASVLYEKR